MIFDPTTCCACAAVQELQGEAPLTLSGEGLWAGVLSSGQCVLECPGSQSAAGSSGDLFHRLSSAYPVAPVGDDAVSGAQNSRLQA